VVAGVRGPVDGWWFPITGTWSPLLGLDPTRTEFAYKPFPPYSPPPPPSWKIFSRLSSHILISRELKGQSSEILILFFDIYW
jgi:hypothetical protein